MHLKDHLKIPEGLEEYISDYKINLFEIAFLPDEKVKMFQSDFRYVAEYFVANRKAKEGQNSQYNISLEHLENAREFAELMNAITNSKRFSEIPKIIKERGGKEVYTVMFDQAEARGEARGISIGEARGEARGISIGEARGISIGEARGEARGISMGEIIGSIRTLYEDVNLSPREILQKIIKKFSLKKDDAKSYVEKTLDIKMCESDLTAVEESASSSSRL